MNILQLRRGILSLLVLFSLSLLSACASVGYDRDLKGFNYPFPVLYREFESQGRKLKMAYMDLRPESGKANGKTLVLLHGKNFSGFYFDRTAEFALKKGYRVLIPDQVGFGKSSKPEAFQYTLHGLATYTRDLIQSLGIKSYSLLGHSMGGMLGFRMALLFPEEIEALITVNPIGLEDWRTLTSYRSVDALYAQELKTTPESIRSYQSESYFAGEWKPEYDSLIQASSGWAVGPDWKTLARISALTSEMIFTQPVVHEFSAIKVLTHLIIGQRDKTAIGKAWATPENKIKMGNYPRLGREAKHKIPRSKLYEMPGIGHAPFIEDFSAFTAILDRILIPASQAR
jgi:pimeloyl-ACP methyl ester carboxylesterase